MFSYNVYPEVNEKEFYNACEKIEKELPEATKEELLEDVDCSLIQLYKTSDGEIKVFNDYLVDAVYIDSEIELKSFN